ATCNRRYRFRRAMAARRFAHGPGEVPIAVAAVDTCAYVTRRPIASMRVRDRPERNLASIDRRPRAAPGVHPRRIRRQREPRLVGSRRAGALALIPRVRRRRWPGALSAPIRRRFGGD